MSRIRGKNTKPEMIVRSSLHKLGFRYRLHSKALPGKPDIVLPKYRTVIFVHGCFWHGHEGCKDFSPPKTKTDWWMRKIGATQKRDVENIAHLKNQGWKVIIVWECELTSNNRKGCMESIINELHSS